MNTKGRSTIVQIHFFYAADRRDAEMMKELEDRFNECRELELRGCETGHDGRTELRFYDDARVITRFWESCEEVVSACSVPLVPQLSQTAWPYRPLEICRAEAMMLAARNFWWALRFGQPVVVRRPDMQFKPLVSNEIHEMKESAAVAAITSVELLSAPTLCSEKAQVIYSI